MSGAKRRPGPQGAGQRRARSRSSSPKTQAAKASGTKSSTALKSRGKPAARRRTTTARGSRARRGGLWARYKRLSQRHPFVFGTLRLGAIASLAGLVLLAGAVLYFIARVPDPLLATLDDRPPNVTVLAADADPDGQSTGRRLRQRRDLTGCDHRVTQGEQEDADIEAEPRFDPAHRREVDQSVQPAPVVKADVVGGEDVVDPGVGTARRGIGVEVAGGEGVLVGPDNGLLAPAVAMAGGAGRAVELTNPEFRLEAPGATFDGRDLFAPAAAHLCNGVDLSELGPAVDADLLFPGVVPLPQIDDSTVIAQALWTDRFGNVQLNIGPADLPEGFGDVVEVRCSAPTDSTGGVRRAATRVGAFAEISAGAIGLVVDANGMLSLAMDRRSAADELALADGDQVVITALDDDAGSASPVRVDLTTRP